MKETMQIILCVLVVILIVTNYFQFMMNKDLRFWRDHYREEYYSINDIFNNAMKNREKKQSTKNRLHRVQKETK